MPVGLLHERLLCLWVLLCLLAGLLGLLKHLLCLLELLEHLSALLLLGFHGVVKAGHLLDGIKFKDLTDNLVQDAEKLGAASTSNQDDRLTRMGRVIRKFKLDELAQLFNVAK